jgi:hypothetical protein
MVEVHVDREFPPFCVRGYRWRPRRPVGLTLPFSGIITLFSADDDAMSTSTTQSTDTGEYLVDALVPPAT